MKKLLCLLFLLLLLTGCGQKEQPACDVETLTSVTTALPVTPEGIRMELVEAGSDDAVIRYTNETERVWEYGFHYSLHIRIDGQWYWMPHRTDTDVGYAFVDLAYTLNPGENREWTCKFRDWMYGPLPVGEYRLVTDYAWVEFDVEAQLQQSETAVQEEQNMDLLPGAENSLLEIWKYDGNTVWRRILQQPDVEKLLCGLRQETWKSVKADPTSIQLPVYSFRGCADGNAPVGGIWADGVFFREDGQTFVVDLDFSPWFSDAAGGDRSLLPAVPCVHLFAKAADRWNTNFLYSVEDRKTASKGLFLQLSDRSKDRAFLKISNASKTDWVYYGDVYTEVFLDGVWYRIPEGELEWWVETEVVPWTVERGKNGSFSYGLPYQGDLPAGQYRIVVDGMNVEFEIK